MVSILESLLLISFMFVVAGALNAGCTAAFNYDPLRDMFSDEFEKSLYILFGIGAVLLLVEAIRNWGEYRDVFDRVHKKDIDCCWLRQPANGYGTVNLAVACAKHQHV